ncbi:MAG: ABC transporter substrate-binding protein [Treponema sp.]|nr:ABC transporter substrate-binding protein [Treponema sp.]
MKRGSILLLAMLILVIAAGTVFVGCRQQTQQVTGPAVYTFPRNETLYLSGLQWSAPSGNQPYVSNAHALAGNGARQLVYETLFIHNMLDGKLYPQLAASYSFGGADGRVLTVQLNPNAKFSNGAAVTAADVVYTFQLGQNYDGIAMNTYWPYLDSVTAQGNSTVVFTGKSGNFNQLSMLRAISEISITPKAYWEAKLASGELGKGRADLVGFPGWDSYGSGPYMFYFGDDTKLVLIRNDNYWGAHASHRGKLPAPRFVINNVYADNAAGDSAFRAAQVDISQQFIAQIETFFQYNIQTYLPAAPWHIPGVIPSIVFNTQKPGLNEAAVRRAIAMVINYDQIGINAMSGQTAPKEAHMMLPTTTEKALIDESQLRAQQWTGIDTAGANRILDQAGWVRGSDGVRAKGGVRLAFQIQCPYGWSDWNASCEIVADSARAIGINITTYFPEAPTYYVNRDTGNFDILMLSPGGVNITSPWSRAYEMMASNYLPPVGTPNTIGNYGRFQNAEAERIIDQIPNTTDPVQLKDLWTKLNIIYLQEMPAAGLMYRPGMFHAVNTTHWTNYPRAGDGSNIPPTCFIDGYGILGLYQIRPAAR